MGASLPAAHLQPGQGEEKTGVPRLGSLWFPQDSQIRRLEISVLVCKHRRKPHQRQGNMKLNAKGSQEARDSEPY